MIGGWFHSFLVLFLFFSLFPVSLSLSLSLSFSLALSLSLSITIVSIRFPPSQTIFLFFLLRSSSTAFESVQRWELGKQPANTHTPARTALPFTSFALFGAVACLSV
ncbi:hypothetical protein DFJ73DRAFT_851882 [Zopfochytrium polystomum]|nr:hypothetical protein DFJ73DRAFT_851882 [Zopfochytrium polystomum]